MEKVQLPQEVMIDLLGVSCRRYGSFQLPSSLCSAFESGRSLAIAGSRRHENVVVKSREQTTAQLRAQETVRTALSEAAKRGFGQSILESCHLEEDHWALEINVRVPKPSCEVRREAGVTDGLCECFTWFWRGFLVGLATEVVLAVMKESTKQRSSIQRLEEERIIRRILEARVKTRVFKRGHAHVIEASVEAGQQ